MAKQNEIDIVDVLMLAGAIAYFVLPFDLIPDVLAGVGYSDDMAALTIAFRKASAIFSATSIGKANEKAAKIFGDKFDPEMAARLVLDAQKKLKK
ncbi:MAG: DUF1232 domain-containing protein [Muribaculaceae bacterium]|jgi:uncharacterized membrane protein YkvA (DUF1232 family)|nr:DUF1232 domain-containing protein [Muribaculaceae bacterium]